MNLVSAYFRFAWDRILRGMLFEEPGAGIEIPSPSGRKGEVIMLTQDSLAHNVVSAFAQLLYNTLDFIGVRSRFREFHSAYSWYAAQVEGK